MQNKGKFNGPDIAGAIGSIFGVLDRRDRVSTRRRPVWAGAIVLSLVAFLGSVLWYSYPNEVEKREIMAVPIIRADAGPIKIMPNDPGGMDIPYRDSTVFETLHAGRDDLNNIENLLPDPEEPVSRDQVFAGLRTEIKVEGREVFKEDIAGNVEEPKARKEPQKIVEDITEPVIIAKNTVKVTPVPQEKPVSSVAEKVSRTEPAAGVQTYERSGYGGYFVQLASLRSDAAAQTAWKDLQKSLFVLKSLDHRIKRAELGTRGVYYRVQAGPMDEARAREICVAVEAQRPGGCLVVKN